MIKICFGILFLIIGLFVAGVTIPHGGVTIIPTRVCYLVVNILDNFRHLPFLFAFSFFYFSHIKKKTRIKIANFFWSIQLAKIFLKKHREFDMRRDLKKKTHIFISFLFFSNAFALT